MHFSYEIVIQIIILLRRLALTILKVAEFHNHRHSLGSSSNCISFKFSFMWYCNMNYMDTCAFFYKQITGIILKWVWLKNWINNNAKLYHSYLRFLLWIHTLNRLFKNSKSPWTHSINTFIYNYPYLLQEMIMSYQLQQSQQHWMIEIELVLIILEEQPVNHLTLTLIR